MNRARLITYEQARSEIQAYIEARLSQFAFRTVAAKNTADPIDVDSFGKGGKKGKKGKKGEDDRTARKEAKVKTRVRIRILARTLVGGRTECWSNSEERHRRRSGLVGTRRTSCWGGITTAPSSCEFSGLGVGWNSCHITAPRSRRLVEMDI